MAKCIKCEHSMYMGVCENDACKCICESDKSYEANV